VGNSHSLCKFLRSTSGRSDTYQRNNIIHNVHLKTAIAIDQALADTFKSKAAENTLRTGIWSAIPFVLYNSNLLLPGVGYGTVSFKKEIDPTLLQGAVYVPSCSIGILRCQHEGTDPGSWYEVFTKCQPDFSAIASRKRRLHFSRSPVDFISKHHGLQKTGPLRTEKLSSSLFIDKRCQWTSAGQRIPE